MDLAEWAQTQHIHPQTAYGWFRQGRLPVPARRVGGLVMVGDLEPAGGSARTPDHPAPEQEA
jgi:predicted site-specific integrase-resolvase